MADLYVKCPHPESSLKTLTVKVELEPEKDYLIKSARVLTFKAKDSLKESARDDFGPDDFSRKLAEHGFEENEVRFAIEEAIENMGQEETLL